MCQAVDAKSLDTSVETARKSARATMVAQALVPAASRLVSTLLPD
jgi:hypothetical protein